MIKLRSRLFKPTIVGKFGEGAALIVGGLASAKAFSVLSQMHANETKCQMTNRLVWDLWAKMAQGETANLRLRCGGNAFSGKKFRVMEKESADLETCLRIGAVLGDASENEVEYLGRIGSCLGIILELSKDFLVSINLSLGLSERIRSGALSYSLLWAREHSEKIRKKLGDLANSNSVQPSDIREIVEDIFEAKAFDNTLRIINKFTNKAQKDLSELEKNRGTRMLGFFVKAQSKLLIESLSTFQV